VLKGKVHKFGDNINTDEIISAKYLAISDPQELGRHCLETKVPDFFQKVNKGDFIVAGRNFGCGSSREHAPVSIKGAGISCVIATSFARIFYRNSINLGLPILECAQAAQIRQGDVLEVDLLRGTIKNLTQKKIYRSKGFPDFMQELIKAGGLIPWIKKGFTESR
jgi:3-isopropylmalate/(R)-2-methylmalate dehydratase small subunit